MRSVRFHLWHGSFRRNTFVVLPLPESMAQCGADIHDQSRGSPAVLVVNDGIIQSISILTAVIRPLMKFDVHNPGMASARKWSGPWPFVRSFWHTINWIWAVYTTFHMLCHRKKILMVCQKGINGFQTLCVGFKAVETIKLCYNFPCSVN